MAIFTATSLCNSVHPSSHPNGPNLFHSHSLSPAPPPSHLSLPLFQPSGIICLFATWQRPTWFVAGQTFNWMYPIPNQGLHPAVSIFVLFKVLPSSHSLRDNRSNLPNIPLHLTRVQARTLQEPSEWQHSKAKTCQVCQIALQRFFFTAGTEERFHPGVSDAFGGTNITARV